MSLNHSYYILQVDTEDVEAEKQKWLHIVTDTSLNCWITAAKPHSIYFLLVKKLEIEKTKTTFIISVLKVVY